MNTLPIPDIVASTVLSVLAVSSRFLTRVTGFLETQQPDVLTTRRVSHGSDVESLSWSSTFESESRSASPAIGLRDECFDRMIALYVAN